MSLLAFFILSACSETYTKKGTITNEQNKATDDTVVNLNNAKEPIDLFGVEMVGSPETILQEIIKNPYIQDPSDSDSSFSASSDHFVVNVLIGGYTFAMNVRYDNGGTDGIVKEVRFLTSNTDDEVLRVIVSKLTEYYGKSEIDDGEQGGYTWFLSGRTLKARHLHDENGGWTFFII